MLSLQGNTAPYLQNAYVRIRSIMRRVSDKFSPPPAVSLNDAAEIQLAKKVCQFAEVVPQVLNDFRPNILTNYLFELANSFHSFYEACPVLKAEEPSRSSRLALSDLAGRVLKTGLNLLGIAVPEKM
jgi:arginyl-tRNA synthetase